MSRLNDQTKAALINAARGGMARPEEGTAADERLRQYIDPNSTDFDPDFVDDLRMIDADWVISPSRTLMVA